MSPRFFTMEPNLALVLSTSFILLFIFIIVTKLLSSKSTTPRRCLPPSPPLKLPILGHLHLIKPPLHRTLHTLSQKLGPIISLQFGSRLVVVVSSPSLVEECFTKNDILLANRPKLTMGKYVGYNYTTIVGSSYGDHWRNLRRLCALEIFSTTRLNAFLSIRRDEVNRLLKRVAAKGGGGFGKVGMRSNLNELSFNIIMRMICGRRYYGEDVENGEEVVDMIEQLFVKAGASNATDYVPFLKRIGYKGYERDVKMLGIKMNQVLEGIIEENRRESRNSMVDHLLSLQKSQPEYYTDSLIKGLMVVMILAGTDTSSVTLEWAMTCLLNHPEALKKATTEIDTIIGQDRLLEEADLSYLPHLQNIISETFRLCPAVPLLLPHESSADCTIGGYDVPRGTMVLVNAWGIQRDPDVWNEPMEFKPERFEDSETEPYKLMPFGLGRRACPGMGLAQRELGLALGSLIQCFEWKRIGEKQIDLTEGTGLSMPKAEPLEALFKTREILDKVVL